MTLPLRLCVRRVLDAAARATVVTVRVPSEITCIEEAVSVVTRHCLAGVHASPRMRFRLQVALSEALSNAIIQGNREDSGKWVYVRATLGSDAIDIDVADEGIGFDPTAVPEPIGPDRIEECGGRGLFLIRKLVDDVHFNEQGNAICMTLRRP